MCNRRALAFILCVVALGMLASGVMIPVLPTIVPGFMAGAAEMFGVFATGCGHGCRSCVRRGPVPCRSAAVAAGRSS